MRSQTRILFLVAIIAAAAIAGCVRVDGERGTFERTLQVTGPVALDLRNGSGSVEISVGSSGQVRILGEYRVSNWTFGPRPRFHDLADNPPIQQEGNRIRIGYDDRRLRNISIRYTITVPAETEVEARTGSGRLDLRDVRGPVQLTTGSGSIQARNVASSAHAETGSGRIEVQIIGGETRLSTGSGSISAEDIRGDVRASTGSGSIELRNVSGRVEARTGSGSIEVFSVTEDLRARTGSGGIHVEGNPAASRFWDLSTGSGGITVDVPDNASFRFYGHGRRIETDLPMTVEERSRRLLRGRVGRGDARIEAETSSGRIRVH